MARRQIGSAATSAFAGFLSSDLRLRADPADESEDRGRAEQQYFAELQRIDDEERDQSQFLHGRGGGLGDRHFFEVGVASHQRDEAVGSRFDRGEVRVLVSLALVVDDGVDERAGFASKALVIRLLAGDDDLEGALVAKREGTAIDDPIVRRPSIRAPTRRGRS